MKTLSINCSAIVLASLLASAANAQAAPAAAAKTDTAPGDIVVTAQKRTERLQDVPVAVSVVSGASLAAQGGVNLENAQYLVPALNFHKGGPAINQTLFLRGVGTAAFSLAGEPSISTVVDGVVYSRAGEAFADLVDVERIEVLRGPQGTLFGKNASAGVVNIVTKRPTDQLGGWAEASYATGNEYRLRGAINGPLADNINGRLVGYYGKYDGNINNIAANVNSKVNGYEHFGVRGEFELKASPDVSFLLIADYRKASDNCCAEVIGATNVGGVATNAAPAGLAGLALAGTQFNGDKSRTIAQNNVTKSLEDGGGVSLQVDAKVGTHTFTSISAYRIYNDREIRDGDFVSAAYQGLNQLHDDGPQSGKTFTQEIRLTSPAKQLFSYVLGAYYYYAKTDRTFTRTDIVCNGAAVTVLVPCGSALAPPSSTFSGTGQFGSVFKNYAVYGQGVLNLSSKFKLIAGARYTSDQLAVYHSRVSTLAINGSGQQVAAPGIQPNFDQGVYNYLTTVAPAQNSPFPLSVSNGVPFTASTSSTNFSVKGGAEFAFTRNNMVYASYTEGYKGPAYNIFFNLTTLGTPALAPETSTSYEIGTKNTLFHGRMTLNLAAYYAKYKNFQANSPTLVANVITTNFVNAGDISTRGVELDTSIRPIRDLTLSGGLAYTDAHVDHFFLAPGANPATVVADGTRLGSAPEWKGSATANYRVRSFSAVDIELGAEADYQSSQISQFDPSAVNRALTTIHPYALVNISLGLVDKNDKWRITGQIKNLFDESFAAAITTGGPGGTLRYIIPREADRYFGITAHYNFGGK
jgi:iron complex outermembrane receptor protein